MKKNKIHVSAFLILFVFLFFPLPLFSASINDITVLKISPQDQSAVIKTANNKLQILKSGDKIGENGRVLEIDKTRIVVEESTVQGKETVIIYFENGKQRLERISKGAVPNQLLYAPQTAVEQ